MVCSTPLNAPLGTHRCEVNNYGYYNSKLECIESGISIKNTLLEKGLRVPKLACRSPLPSDIQSLSIN